MIPSLLPALPTAAPDAGDQVADGANAFLDWLLGPGLRIAIIVVAAGIVLLLVRRLIKTVSEHIADGTSLLQRGIGKPLGGTEVAAALRKVTPVANARRAQRARTIGSVLRSTAAIVVGSIAVLLVLDQLGVNIAPFIASAGIIGVAFGFGAQSLVKDFLSGLFMLLEDQYGVGDVVDVGPAQGTVESVGLRVTKIRDGDGTLWYVPNGSMLRVGNKTQGWANAVVEVKVDYFADLDRVQDLLIQAAATLADIPEIGAAIEGAATVTTAEDLTFDAVSLKVIQRTAPARQWAVARALRTAVREALEAADIPLAGQREALEAHRERTSPEG
ncbi:mechanosensitive ion channel family protein [Cellulomonas triticagri]|uniref:Mechanosensitive ion channel family protein n=1 Tax=Cellulomonas triticagri TaxID=2483352 RepID=A0A3M2JVL2_9CELL|nr:mechanosensitive ion channel family protein [Cellulomonas triticagri]RMI14088.1 mechanosensitive ion channel family protein [Cellulomonas triticagri]